MKSILTTIFILFASMASAEDFIVLWLNMSASTHDKVTVRNGLYTLLNDKTKIDATQLPQWRLIANTNTVGWVLVINAENPKRLKANVENLSVAKLNTWKENNLDTPNYLQWCRGEDWRQLLIDAGLEPVPTEKLEP